MPVRTALHYTHQASHDLEDIADYLREEAGTAIALRFLDAVDHTTDLLRVTPYIGTALASVSVRHSNVRRLPLSAPFGRWMLFYEPAPTEIRIDRVLHSAQDWPRYFR
jgi:plasmid stabilization system protein ParE